MRQFLEEFGGDMAQVLAVRAKEGAHLRLGSSMAGTVARSRITASRLAAPMAATVVKRPEKRAADDHDDSAAAGLRNENDNDAKRSKGSATIESGDATMIVAESAGPVPPAQPREAARAVLMSATSTNTTFQRLKSAGLATPARSMMSKVSATPARIGGAGLPAMPPGTVARATLPSSQVALPDAADVAIEVALGDGTAIDLAQPKVTELLNSSEKLAARRRLEALQAQVSQLLSKLG